MKLSRRTATPRLRVVVSSPEPESMISASRTGVLETPSISASRRSTSSSPGPIRPDRMAALMDCATRSEWEVEGPRGASDTSPGMPSLTALVYHIRPMEPDENAEWNLGRPVGYVWMRQRRLAVALTVAQSRARPPIRCPRHRRDGGKGGSSPRDAARPAPSGGATGAWVLELPPTRGAECHDPSEVLQVPRPCPDGQDRGALRRRPPAAGRDRYAPTNRPHPGRVPSTPCPAGCPTRRSGSGPAAPGRSGSACSTPRTPPR